jgi:hypothetical protein
MNNERTWDFVEFSYFRHLYCIDIEKKNLLPIEGGIYIIYERGRIYCGSTANLSKRVPESVREQGFGQFAFFYPAKFLEVPSSFGIDALVDLLESQCISALYTIIFGNGLPLQLSNKRDAEILPSVEWNIDEGQGYSLGVEIAQTILYQIGLPNHMSGLPFHGILHTDIPEAIATKNAGKWSEIFAIESKARRCSSHPKGPLICEKLK